MHHAKYFGTRFYNGIGTLLLPSEIVITFIVIAQGDSLTAPFVCVSI